MASLLHRTSERVLLDESKLDGRNINLEAETFKLGIDGGSSYLERCRKDADLPIYLYGIIQSGDKPNRNNRIYPWDYLKKECIRYMENEVKNGLSYGELDHPEESSTPMLNNACWTIEDMSFKGKDVHAKILVLSAYMPDTAPGKKVRGFLLNKKNVGISSRALGSVEQYSNSPYDIVAEDLEMVCWDGVSNASNFGSEKLEMVQENKVIVPNARAKALLTESQLKGYSKGRKDNIGKLLLTEEERVYLNILGLQDFLRIYLKA